MEINQIEERIEKKQAQIAKIEKRIAKWEAAKSDKGFKKEYDWLCQDGKYFNRATQAYDTSYEDFKAERYMEHEASCNSEIRSANRDLKEAQVQLDKYFNMLKAEQVKLGKLNEERIQVIMDFLSSWKQKVIDYTHENVKLILKYYEADSKACEFHNTKMWKMEDKEAAKAELRKLRNEAKAIKELINDLSFDVYCSTADNRTNDAKLNAILDKEVDNKYLRLVDSITEKVGEITDSSCLKIGVKGDIEGYITGTKGKVHIETIGAGGYNIQCYHFRTLIKSVK